MLVSLQNAEHPAYDYHFLYRSAGYLVRKHTELYNIGKGQKAAAMLELSQQLFALATEINPVLQLIKEPNSGE